MDTKDLKIPHPEIEKRSFVLIPLMEISPSWVHPVKNIGIKAIWDDWMSSNKEDLPKKLDQEINLNVHMLSK